MHDAVLQNALKIFEQMPKSLMDIVKRTDPSTVTQHGLYMRPLTDPSLHPLVAKAPPVEPPGTPPQEEEQKTSAVAALGSGHQSQDEDATKKLAESEAKAEQSVNSEQSAVPQAASRASADAMPSRPKTAPASTARPLLKKEQSSKTDVQPSGDTSSSPAGSKGSFTVPAGTPSSPTSTSLTPMGISSKAPLAAPSIPEGKGLSPKEKDPPAKGSTVASAPESMPAKESGPGKEAECLEPVHSETWGRGRVTLLGDAAHATIPNGGHLNLAHSTSAVHVYSKAGSS